MARSLSKHVGKVYIDDYIIKIISHATVQMPTPLAFLTITKSMARHGIHPGVKVKKSKEKYERNM